MLTMLCAPLVIITTTEGSIFAVHPTLTAFNAVRPCGYPLWKSTENEVAVLKCYKRRKGMTMTEAKAYSHLRSIALAKPILFRLFLHRLLLLHQLCLLAQLHLPCHLSTRCALSLTRVLSNTNR